ncbi:hypothetical protein MAR_033591 [Mya arenaria]|uniref:Uncharacterized protein n=1 Tax=Mya arenaria TaxID=6604 RepID=A0ABY7GBT2_MYAAR|nr:hypothetical protein MAR_033591 [Mya arenaria]
MFVNDDELLIISIFSKKRLALLSRLSVGVYTSHRDDQCCVCGKDADLVTKQDMMGKLES